MRFDDVAIQGIIQGRRVIGRVAFPGSKDIMIGVRLLSETEIDNARFEAQFYLERRAKSAQLSLLDFVRVDPESLDREQQRHVILAAFVDPDSPPGAEPKPFFQSMEQIRKLDSVLVYQLWEIYADWQDVINPHIKMTEEEVTALIDSLKKEHAEKLILAPLGRETLQGLVRILAARLST